MFNNCMAGALHGRTRLLVTNQLQFVSAADTVLFMAGGRIAEMGTYRDLMARGGPFAQMMSQAEVRELDGAAGCLCCWAVDADWHALKIRLCGCAVQLPSGQDVWDRLHCLLQKSRAAAPHSTHHQEPSLNRTILPRRNAYSAVDWSAS